MSKRAQITIALLSFVTLTIVISKANNNPAPAPAPVIQAEYNTEPAESALAPELDVNTQKFTLVDAKLICSSSCSGDIYIVPLTSPEHDPGLFKISEQTQLLHNGQPQNMAGLEQLAHNRTTVELEMVSQTDPTIAEILY